jgi:hypothetical protein
MKAPEGSIEMFERRRLETAEQAKALEPPPEPPAMDAERIN